MAEPREPSDNHVEAVDAVVETKRRFSIIWVVPIAAALVGAWLVYKSQVERGPTVTVIFSASEGVVAGKTKVKYKDVEVGQVDSVELSEDLSKVIVKATLDKTLEGHLSENSSFWIVTPRFAGGTISGLDTLFSGVYIGMDPGDKGGPQREFVGLEDPPLVSSDTPGRHFVVTAGSLGSLNLGSPVYYRQLKAGQVESFKLTPDGKSVRLRVFINAPYDKYVYEGTRFWNASGISASLTADGIKVSTESIIALLVGGIAFDAPMDVGTPVAVKEGHAFELFDSESAADSPIYKEKRPLLMYFSGSVRGLSVGAPLDMRGIQVGEVTHIELQADPLDFSFRIPVKADYEPGRVKFKHAQARATTAEEWRRRLQILVDKGLRAQLKTGSIITGQLFIDFDFHPNAPPAKLNVENGIVVFPTIPSSLEEFRTSLTDLLNKLHKLPLEEIGNDLRSTVRGASELTNSVELRQALVNLNRTMANSEQLTAQLNLNTAPALEKTLNEAIAALTALQQNILQEDSAIYYELTRTLTELSDAARSVSGLADYLERHPDALIKGK